MHGLNIKKRLRKNSRKLLNLFLIVFHDVVHDFFQTEM